jgi:hypothetical protein
MPKDVFAQAWMQGGAVLLLVALLVAALICTYKYIVKPLWEDNKLLREKVMVMNERVVTMGEASRQTNETCTKAFIEQSASFRDMVSAWRQK